MLKYSGVYLAVLITMVLVDILWLRVIAVSWYQQGMGSLLAESPNLWAAGAFYLLFPIGLTVFGVIMPGDGADLLKVALFGALFGFFAYATYDLTNLAVVKGWPVGLSLLDMTWGSFVSGLSCVAGKLCLNYLNR